MTLSMSRRLVLAAVLLTASIAPAIAQTNLRFAAVFSDRDIRARMIEMLAKEVEKDFKIEPFYNGNAFQAGHRAGRACSGTISSLATSHRRTFPSSFQLGRSSPPRTSFATPSTLRLSGPAISELR